MLPSHLIHGQGSENTLTFNGTNEGIDLGDQVFSNCRTIEMWFKPHTTIDATLIEVQTLIARDYNSASGLNINEVALCFNRSSWGNGGRLAFYRRDSLDLSYIFSDSNYWLANQWYHVVATVDPVSGMKMYVNGVLQQDTHPSTEEFNVQSGSVWDKVCIGKWGNLTIRYYSGEIDDIRIWEDERSQTEIRENMCCRLIGNESGLRAYYRFDSQTGNTLTDNSQNNYDGTMINMSNSNWIYSGAPIGDTSTYLYNSSLAGQSLLLSTGPGDKLLVDNIISQAKGVQIYKVDTLPNTILNLSNPVTGNYYGIFLCDISGTFDVNYYHSDYTCSSCNKIFSRNDNSVLNWTNVIGTYSNCSFNLSNQSTVGSDYRAEYIIDIDVVTINLGNDTTLCQGETLMLDATTPGASYLWQDNSTNPTYTVIQSGTYWVEVTVNNCIVSDTISVDIFPKPVVDLGNDTTLCPGDTLMLVVTDTNSTCLWQDSTTNPVYTISQPGVYWVEVTNNCATTIDTLNIDYYTDPLFDLGKDTSLCEGETLVLDATTPSSSYLWQDNSTNATLTVSVMGPYWVEVTNYCATNSDTIDVNFKPLPQIYLGDDTTLCQGDPLTLDATTVNATYLWQDNSTDSILTVTQQGIYWVEVTVENCSNNDSIEIYYNPLPEFSLGNDTTPCLGEILILDVTTANATCLWQDNSTNPTYTVSGTGKYWVEVTANKCSSSDTVYVEFVQCEVVLEMPNVFTPNSDGINETFHPIKMENVVHAILIVYNRWGKKLYEGSSVMEGWDGKNNGKDCSEGTYFWIVKYKGINGNDYHKNGSLTLIR